MANQNNWALAKEGNWKALGFVPSQPALAVQEYYEFKWVKAHKAQPGVVLPRQPDEPCPNRQAWHAGVGSYGANPSPPYPTLP